MADSRSILSNHPEEYARFSIPVPEYYNFGFDVIDEWAKKTVINWL